MDSQFTSTVQLIQQILPLIDSIDKNTMQELLRQISQPHQGNIAALQNTLLFIEQNILLRILALTTETNSSIYLSYEMKKIAKVAEMIPSILSSEKVNDIDVEYRDIDEPESIERSLQGFISMVFVGHAYVHSGAEINNKATRAMVTNASGLYYLVEREKARKLSYFLLANPTIEHIQKSWGVIGLEKSLVVKNAIKGMLDPIAINRKLYIPRVFQPVTLEESSSQPKTLLSLPPSLTYDHLFGSLFSKKEHTVKIRLLSAQKCIIKDFVDSGEISTIINKLQVDQKLNYVYKNTQYSKGNQFIRQGPLPSLFCWASRKSQAPIIKKVVIHFHGGGFVAMSSFSHQTYTRKWANHLGDDTAVFSVDYRLAPQHPYPAALDDCWQAYMWIVHFSECFLNISPEQIILAGDSAGGNLCMGVTFRAIQCNVRVPDALFLMYPALILDLNYFLPSLLKCLTDQIVPFTILELCMRSYIPPYVDPRHLYLSPGLCADESLLSRFPGRIQMITGTEDCLQDQSIIFASKLRGLGKEAHVISFKHFPHGFMNYAFPKFGLTQAGQVVLESCMLLAKLFR